MAPLNNLLLASSMLLLSSGALAAPAASAGPPPAEGFTASVAAAHLNVVWDVVTETVWTTVDVTTTVYGDASSASTTSAEAVATTSPAPAPAVSSSAAAEFFSTSSSSSASAAPVVPTTLATSSTSSAAVIASTSASAPVASSSTPAASSSAATSAASAEARSADASTTADCEGEGNACIGDITHWDGGLGACGTEVDTNGQLGIALPYEFMGTLSNTNPYCGRTITVQDTVLGTSVQATVVDKCMGCVDRAIDCTNLLFNEVTQNTGDGRVHNIVWWLN